MGWTSENISEYPGPIDNSNPYHCHQMQKRVTAKADSSRIAEHQAKKTNFFAVHSPIRFDNFLGSRTQLCPRLRVVDNIGRENASKKTSMAPSVIAVGMILICKSAEAGQ